MPNKTEINIKMYKTYQLFENEKCTNRIQSDNILNSLLPTQTE